MTNYCIAIGIDGYVDPAWELGACVADALAFADWAVESGKVDPANLRMLIAPPGGVPATVTLPDSGHVVANIAPSRIGITQLLLNEIKTADWAAGDRLYFYFAGHGCSHEYARDRRPEPVLFPVDVEQLPLHSYLLLGFEDILSLLRAHGPKEQLIFIDACRDFALANYASSAGVSSGRYFRPTLEDSGASQNILYATAPGERSLELGLGKGVFSAALLDGLRGHPAALQRLAGRTDYQLTFSRLAHHVRKTVDTKVRRLLLDTTFRYVQAPELDRDARQPEFEIDVFPGNAIPEQPLHVRVTPSDQIGGGRVDVFYESRPWSRHGPPLKATTEIRLKPSFYDVEARGRGLISDRVTVEIPYDGILDLELKAPKAQIEPTSLQFRVDDQSMPIVVIDPAGDIINGIGWVTIDDPVRGHYRAAVLSPGRPFDPKAFAFPECGKQVTLDVAPPALTEVSAAAVSSLNMETTAVAVHPAEVIGAVAEFRMTSLLAFSAYAAYSSPLYDMQKLRSIDLDPIERRSSEPWLTVLVGATGYQPVKGETLDAFIAAIRLLMPDETRPVGSEGQDKRLRPLEKVPGTGQFTARCPQGSFSVEVSLPGVPPTRFAMNGMAGRVATLVIGMGDDQVIEVQQYIFRLGGGAIEERDLPVLEKAQRFFVAGEAIPEVIIDRLLNAKLSDPLSACLAGYSLVREGRREEFAGDYRPGDRAWNPDSALQNMLNNFDGLADTHVLAGLCDPDRRPEHFHNALSRGVPIFADGIRTLIEFYGDRLDRFPSELDRARRTLSVGTAYTSWLSREPSLGIVDGRFDPPPAQWRQIEVERDRIEFQLSACGLVRIVSDGKMVGSGSGFLVAPDLVATADHVASAIFDESGDVRANLVITFDTGDAVKIGDGHLTGVPGEVIRFDRDRRLALLELARPLSHEPLALATGNRATPGRSIYVVGYAADAAQGLARKHVWPGYIMAAAEDGPMFDHDAGTIAGSGGSPVIDVASGMVTGIHWGGLRRDGYKVNRASRVSWEEYDLADRLRDHS